MGNLRDLQIEKSYSSENQNLLKDFYVPVLKCAKKYDRISGFFSPKILSVAARGFAQAIKNDIKIRLVTSIKVDRSLMDLSADDIQNALQLNIIQWDINDILDELEKDYLGVFSYLLSSGMLEMKIAIMNNDGILHQKVGIITDADNNSISFSGSNNETVYGWETNDEEFKVFTNWNISSIEYFDSDRKKFEKIWNDDYAHAKVINLPDAIREQLIEYTKTEENIDKVIERIKEKEAGSITKPANTRELRPYQLDAIRHWFDNDFVSIFAMATGTGKTFTTMNALKQFRETTGSLNAVIAVPLRTLAEQWENEVIDFFPDLAIINTTESSDWKRKIESLENDYENRGISKDFVIITTYASFPTIAESRIGDGILLVADEMHNLATDRGLKAAASDLFKYKIGLSATPERLWKPSESAALSQLFGDNRFEFGIEQALENGCLVNFNYYPNFIELTFDEYEEYIRLSRKIAKMSASNSADIDDGYDAGNNEALNSELIKRARIKKNAEHKIPYIVQQLKALKGSSKLDRALIYVDNEAFLDDLQNELASSRIVTSRYLGGTPTDERTRIVNNLCANTIDAIVAIKCLDEGVDIPSARQAFILSNGTDPREYVQRLGRVLRKDDKTGKKLADVHDYLILPPSGIRYSDDFERKATRNMVKNEIKRSDFFVNLANNRDDAKDQIAEKVFSLGFDFTDDINEEGKEI